MAVGNAETDGRYQTYDLACFAVDKDWMEHISVVHAISLGKNDEPMGSHLVTRTTYTSILDTTFCTKTKQDRTKQDKVKKYNCNQTSEYLMDLTQFYVEMSCAFIWMIPDNGL